MILEVAILDVISAQEKDFESAFEKASPIIASMPGYISHQLQRCIEKQNRYILLVNWEKLEDHTVGFRGSEEYQEWRRLREVKVELKRRGSLRGVLEMHFSKEAISCTIRKASALNLVSGAKGTK